MAHSRQRGVLLLGGSAEVGGEQQARRSVYAPFSFFSEYRRSHRGRFRSERFAGRGNGRDQRAPVGQGGGYARDWRARLPAGTVRVHLVDARWRPRLAADRVEGGVEAREQIAESR